MVTDILWVGNNNPGGRGTIAMYDRAQVSDPWIYRQTLAYGFGLQAIYFERGWIVKLEFIPAASNYYFDKFWWGYDGAFYSFSPMAWTFSNGDSIDVFWGTYAHQNTAHADWTNHSDTHADITYATHQDTAYSNWTNYSNSHSDYNITGHTDNAHADWTNHSDTHTDTTNATHQDTAHADWTDYSDVAHEDAPV